MQTEYNPLSLVASPVKATDISQFFASHVSSISHFPSALMPDLILPIGGTRNVAESRKPSRALVLTSSLLHHPSSTFPPSPPQTSNNSFHTISSLHLPPTPLSPYSHHHYHHQHRHYSKNIPDMLGSIPPPPLHLPQLAPQTAPTPPPHKTRVTASGLFVHGHVRRRSGRRQVQGAFVDDVAWQG